MKASSLAGLIRVWTLLMTVSLILLGASYASFLGFKINFATLLLALFDHCCSMRGQTCSTTSTMWLKV
ncbi:MAG: hypothetical protein RXR21_05820 [Nitrososphaeria archaeon]